MNMSKPSFFALLVIIIMIRVSSRLCRFAEKLSC
jgi:hypothetical protein